RVDLIPQGIPRPYVTLLPYMASGEKRTFPLTGFRAQDGTKYRSDIAKGKSVKVTATDSNGQVRQREVPYNYAPRHPPSPRRQFGVHRMNERADVAVAVRERLQLAGIVGMARHVVGAD